MNDTPYPYRIFNDEIHSSSAEALFSPFARLPPELRRMIWTHCFSAPRLVRIILRDDDDLQTDYPDLYKTTNKLGNVISGHPYHSAPEDTDGCFYPNSFDAISREAQSVYRHIYRTRFPLRVRSPDGTIIIRILPINPENTVLWLGTEQNCRGPALVNIMHDLVAYDPNGVGIVQLAVGGSSLMDMENLSVLKPEHLPQPARASFTRLLRSSIRSFYSVVANDGDLRCTLGIMTCPRAQLHRSLSVPLFLGPSSAYRPLKRDPRDVALDLSHVAVMSDPRRAIFRWNTLKATFDKQQRSQVDVGYIVCALPLGPPPEREQLQHERQYGQRQRLLDELAVEDQKWEGWTSWMSQNVWGHCMTQDEYDARKESLPQVAGVWVFGGDAMGSVPDITETKYHGFTEWAPKLLKDLSGFSPELWVFDP